MKSHSKLPNPSVKQEPFPHIQLTFGSAVRFTLDYGIVATAGGGTFHAGDAYEVFPIHDGLTAVLLSDGMGQDLNAYRESRKVIRLDAGMFGSKNGSGNRHAHASLYDVFEWTG